LSLWKPNFSVHHYSGAYRAWKELPSGDSSVTHLVTQSERCLLSTGNNYGRLVYKYLALSLADLQGIRIAFSVYRCLSYDLTCIALLTESRGSVFSNNRITGHSSACFLAFNMTNAYRSMNRYMAISLTRYGFLGSARVKDGLEKICVGILDNVRDIEILKGDKAVDALSVRPKWDNARDTAHTHVSIHCVTYALLQYARPIALLWRSLARTQHTNVSVPAGKDAVKFGDG
jgi:hypothetical protein